MGSIADLFERFGVAIVFVNALLHELGLPIPLDAHGAARRGRHF